ncbi:MAG: T9SS type A sorting domain-containing protein [Bacteroidales bacterium]|nr:T9SS type A sorting domain-containing protein [Bacteroidales bacterium]
MKKNLLLIIALFSLVASQAQVVSTTPSMPVVGQPVTITFRADEGSKGLMGFTGEVYAHTGVITSESTGSSDWQYAVAGWGVNVSKAKMTRVATDLYELNITPDIRTYYGVPEGEDILQMAFVFRSATTVNGNWLEGKASGGTDILVDVYKEALTALLLSPTADALFLPGEAITVNGSGLNADGLRLFLDDELVLETTDLSLSHTFNAPASGSHELRLEAYAGLEVETQTISFHIREAPEAAVRPSGLRLGANVIDDNTATLVLQAPHKAFVYVLGDFNGWVPNPESQMKKDGDYFWLTIENLVAGEEYAYQYYMDGELRLADPYTNKVLDVSNDNYIEDRVYPNLKPFPHEFTTGLASVLNTAPEPYQWQVNDFQVPAQENMVIYEVLIRDFTANGDIKTITDTLDYFQRLGVNAIELMPFNEFEGNDSWGYNPSFFFAPDKAYGTMNDYKAFIDGCHERGIAVIMDLVLNHSFSQSPLLQMYFEDGKPSVDNPWYNREHNMQNPDAQWGYDFNHESLHTQALVDRILSFWLEEFKIDGFRFDFTKGFTNTVYGPTSWASAYDASRIAILKRMANHVWSVKNDAIVIFEHLSDNAEEKELAAHGIMLWGNMNHQLAEAVMGYNESNKSDLAWSSYQKRTWNEPNLVAYMESHDEERVTYKAITYGKVAGAYSAKDLDTALDRHKAAAAFLMTVPGPKMIWQFGELGYDISIDSGGRLGPKPPKWDYLQVPARKALWQVYSELIEMKISEPVFSTTDFTLDVGGAVKNVALNGTNNHVRLVGNFDVLAHNVAPGFSSTGWWFNHFERDSINVTDLNMEIALGAGEFALFTKQKLKAIWLASSFEDKPVAEMESLVIFPNPVDNELNIKAAQSINGIQIFDINGRLVLRSDERRLNPVLNLSALQPGLYLLRIELEDGRWAYHKFRK